MHAQHFLSEKLPSTHIIFAYTQTSLADVMDAMMLPVSTASSA
jgi:hypothetical protein